MTSYKEMKASDLGLVLRCFDFGISKRRKIDDRCIWTAKLQKRLHEESQQSRLGLPDPSKRSRRVVIPRCSASQEG